MDARGVWPDFRREHVLHEDDDLVVVHKPVGVPSQAAHPERPDDLVTRLRAFFGAGYLGVHHRLDRDTSGCVLFTKRTAVNAHIAKQFEGRGVEKRYLAAVRGWPARRDEAVLDDVLDKGDDGRMVVLGRGQLRGRPGARGQRAVTRVRVRRRSGDRALLELVLETGRTHQARVQLAHAGAPIAGDVLYRGAPASRLMLHAASLGIVHPSSQKKLVVKDTAGAVALERWVDRGDVGAGVYDDERALDEAIAIAVERRWGLGRSADRDPPELRTTAFRLVHEEGDALPALAVDVYRASEGEGAWLVAQLHLGPTWDDERRRVRVLDRLGALGFDGVYLKLRPKQANVLVETRRDDVAPKAAVRGISVPAEPMTVLEEGAPHRVWLGDGLSTGIFLDQRPNRVLVRSLAKGKSVLNLFAYTCAFSVVAALGGATRTVSVDASLAALERGRASFEALGLLSSAHTFAGEDAFSWLARAATKGERFDIVVVDPPSYSSTKKRRFVAESDYGDLVAMAAAVTAKGGRIVACCNHRGLGKPKLRKMIASGIRAAHREAIQIKDLPTAPDFPPPLGADPQMKSVLVTLV